MGSSRCVVWPRTTADDKSKARAALSLARSTPTYTPTPRLMPAIASSELPRMPQIET